MAKPLIIVESPTKARTIKKFLPPRYVVKASVGHVRDLPKSTLGVDVDHDFTPKYLTIKGKGDVIKELKAAVKNAGEVYLATDPDREGEAIAWHLAELLKLENTQRIELHEITKEAVLEALAHPHPIDMPRVNAQQARRILDRLVGYKISPLLWAKVRGGLSAGRVQSVAVRLIVDREREIAAFVPREYWSITAHLLPDAGRAQFAADLIAIAGEKADVRERRHGGAHRLGSRRGELADRLDQAPRAAPQRPPPFTTSTLQQEASRRLKIRVRRAMQLAQALYEGVDLGSEGTVGLITYMRTDSIRISDSARDAAREFVTATYGRKLRGRTRSRLREGAQDAHEAIRPTLVHRTPDTHGAASSSATNCGCTPDLGAVRRIADGRRRLRSNHRRHRRVPGHTAIVARVYVPRDRQRDQVPGLHAVYEESSDEEERSRQPRRGCSANGRVAKLAAADRARGAGAQSLEPKQHFTEPPPRYREATLVKALEENGSGAPRPTARSSRRSGRAATSSKSSAASGRPRSVSR